MFSIINAGSNLAFLASFNCCTDATTLISLKITCNYLKFDVY